MPSLNQSAEVEEKEPSCFCCDVSTGLMIWLALSLAGMILNLTTGISHNNSNQAYAIGSTIISAFVTLFAIFAIMKQNVGWIKAFFYFRIVAITLAVVTLCVSSMSAPNFDLIGSGLLAIVVITLSTEGVFLYYVRSLYTFLERRNKTITPESSV